MTNAINAFVLQEFRLHTATSAAEVARIVATFSGGIEPAVPLLTSIDDHRDVATVRGLHPGETADGNLGQRAALDPLVASWQPLKTYAPRITEHSERPPTHYRLAVTESGINNGVTGSPAAVPTSTTKDVASMPICLLWTGVPLGTYAGLILLLGSDGGGDAATSDPSDWPLLLSRSLGVRIYENLN
jgi:hypothetical protein